MAIINHFKFCLCSIKSIDAIDAADGAPIGWKIRIVWRVHLPISYFFAITRTQIVIGTSFSITPSSNVGESIVDNLLSEKIRGHTLQIIKNNKNSDTGE